jgi:hypothetical protein
LRASIFSPGNRLSLLTHPQVAVAISGLRRNGLRDEVLVQIQLGQRRCLSSPVLPICKHRVPDDRCTAAFDAQHAKVELTLTNSAQQFNAGDRDRRGPEPFEAEHRTDAQFHATMVSLCKLIDA